jgi:hypothetical protein
MIFDVGYDRMGVGWEGKTVFGYLYDLMCVRVWVFLDPW